MTLTSFWTLAVLNQVGIVSPGPDLLLQLRLATRSRIHAYFAMAGIVSGLIVWVTLTVVGAAALLSAYPQVLGIIQILGGAYLVFMAVQMMRSGTGQLREGASSLAGVDMNQWLGTPIQCFRQGLATNLSNPKVVLYFAAIMAPLMPADPGVWLSLGLIAFIVAQAMLTFTLLNTIVSAGRIRSWLIGAGPWIDLVSGVVFLVVGGSLVISGITELI